MVTLFSSEPEKPTAITPAQILVPTVVETKLQLSQIAQEFLDERQKSLELYNRGAEPAIRVSEVLGTIAHIYERIRNIVEYKGEHVLRRNAIERILRRLLWE
ncbi:MAG: hypothetical protein ACD_51C00113G0002, partial [uncultured bacterium]